uniref:Uncharacterized protein n=1 Tax=Anguilla anguilla TaxID=7936 RepID=A0A0E9Q9R4_ANGAN
MVLLFLIKKACCSFIYKTCCKYLYIQTLILEWVLQCFFTKTAVIHLHQHSL